MIVIAGVMFYQAEQTLRVQAAASLQDVARRYGQVVQDRLLGASDLLYLIGSGADAPLDEMAHPLESYAVIDRSGRQVTGELGLPMSVSSAFRDERGARLVVARNQEQPRLYLGRSVGDHVAVGLLSSSHLWRAADLPEAYISCAFISTVSLPPSCAAQLPGGIVRALTTAELSSGMLSFDLENEPYLASFLQAHNSTQLRRPEIRVVIGQPRQIAFGAIEQLRGLYIPTLCVGLVLALIGALVYSRRILYPLGRMLHVTRELTRRDVWGRADLRRRDHFSNVAHDLQHMADDLAQQFNARETLSQIDRAILSGADTSQIVDLVLQHIVESVQCRRAAVTLLGPEDAVDAVATMMSRGHPVTRSMEVTVTQDSREWLERHAEGLMLSHPPKGTPCEPFVAVDTPHTYVLPISVQGRPAAAVSIMTMDEAIGLDELKKGHVRDLAGRLAVALEAVSRAEALRRKAYFDDLTGLPNRDFCFERLDNAIKQAKNLGSAVAVMFIDLDGFKAINDSLGHIAGDELIRQSAYRLASCIGESGTIGRLGGDEFAVVLPFPVNSADPEDLAERVLETVSKPFVIGASEIHLSASVGVARYPHDGDTRVELLRKADTAMYSAKEAGRGRKVDYSNTMGIKVDERMRLEVELRRAFENDELTVYYQPQIDMRTGRIVSAEALVRWKHPERGLLLPSEFIPIAEDSGYINVIGGWIMSTACRQLSSWKDEGLGIQRVSVNVSVGQFRRNDFVSVVESSLFELQFASNALEIELTESVFVEDVTQARKTLEQLKNLGVVVSIDDFGTGYSSLGYLKHLTFDAVKVDQSFVHELPHDKESEAIVSAVLAMCHTLGKQVVAEGIETDQQFEYLRKAGVDIGQGFRIGSPMTAGEFARYVNEVERRLDAQPAKQRLRTV